MERPNNFFIQINVRVTWYVKTKSRLCSFNRFLEALEFFNRQKEATIYSTEDITRNI